MTCEQFEIAIEQRRRGALSPAEAERLDIHLAACESCRGFEAAGRSIEDSLDRQATAASIDVDRLDARIATVIGQRNRRLARTIAEQIIFVGFIVWMCTGSIRRAQHMWVPALICMAILVPLAWWSIGRDARRAAQIASGEGDILVWWRARLDRQLAAMRRNLWMWPLFTVVAATLLWMRHRPGMEPRLAISTAILIAWTVGVCISSSRSLGQLMRERASLQ